MLHVDLLESFVDEPVSIRATGLAPNRNYTLTLSVRHFSGIHRSVSVFRASDDGTIDLARDAPVRADYRGVDQMGIFHTLQPTKRGNFVIPIASKPLEYTIELSDAGGRTLDTKQMVKLWAAKTGVRREVIDNGEIIGALHLPDGPGPFPSVFIIEGSGGGLLEHRASGLARRGIATFVVSYIRFRWLPKRFYDVSLAYFDKAVRWFASQPFTGGVIGIHGHSIGATVAMHLAERHHQIRALFSLCASPCFHTLASFTDMPFAELPFNEEPWGLHRGSRSLRALDVPDECKLHFEKTHPRLRILLVGSLSDHITPAVLDAYRFEQQAQKAGRQVDKIFLKLAGHNPHCGYVPHSAAITTHIGNTGLYLGGSAATHGQEQLQVWNRTAHFFKTVLEEELHYEATTHNHQDQETSSSTATTFTIDESHSYMSKL